MHISCIINHKNEYFPHGEKTNDNTLCKFLEIYAVLLYHLICVMSLTKQSACVIILLRYHFSIMKQEYVPHNAYQAAAGL